MRAERLAQAHELQRLRAGCVEAQVRARQSDADAREAAEALDRLSHRAAELRAWAQMEEGAAEEADTAEPESRDGGVGDVSRSGATLRSGQEDHEPNAKSEREAREREARERLMQALWDANVDLASKSNELAAVRDQLDTTSLPAAVSERTGRAVAENAWAPWYCLGSSRDLPAPRHPPCR